MNQLERKNKKKNFVWNAIGLSFNAFNSLFFMIIVTLVNGVDLAGIFTYAFSLCCLFFVLATYYNRTFQVSDHKNQFSFNQYFTARIILSILSIILIVIFSLVSQFDLYKILVIVLIMGFRTIEAISDCFYGAIQKNGELYKTGISYAIKAVSGVLLFLILDLLTHNLLFSIVSLIIVNLALLLFYDLPNYRKFSQEEIYLDFSKIKPLLKKCFPVFVFSALSVYLISCQKYILTYFAPNDIQTVFGILIMPATFLGLIGSYLINPFINRLTVLAKNKNYSKFQKTTSKIIGILFCGGALCSIVCWSLGIPILNIIYNMHLENYRVSLLLAIIAAIFYATAMIISRFLTILKENFWQSILYGAASIVATISSIILIPIHGIPGAIFSFLITGIILAALYIILLFTKINKLTKSKI